ncbi:MAG: hypothetical protein ACAH80_08430 [Alphaproteobacteria bacterium]
MLYYTDIIDMFNRHSDDTDDVEREPPFGMEDMQEWADSLAIACGVLGAAYEDAGVLAQGHYMRPEPVAEPAPPAFDPEECTILRAPMTLRRSPIALTARKPGFFS